jgi:hypothetical protein
VGNVPIVVACIFGPAARPETGVISCRIDGVDVALSGTLPDQSYGIACARDCIARRRRIARSVPFPKAPFK